MSHVTVIAPGAGEIIGDDPGRRVELLCDRGPLNATLSRFGPGMEGADLHVHREHTDFFYVLEGQLTVRLGTGDRQVPVPTGSLAWVPPGIVHGFRNAGDGVMRYLNFHAPGCGFATYMRGLRDGVKVRYDQHDPPPDGGLPIDGAVVSAGTPAAEGVVALGETPALRVTRERGATGARCAEGITAYYALEGDLRLTAGGKQTATPAGSWVLICAGEEHAVDGVVLRVTAPAPS
jgi:quercetin dioxygenase-like cupin family protein